MTQYRLRPSGEDIAHWVLERWVEPYKSWLGTYPGYWSYEREVRRDNVEALRAHLAQPVQYFSGPP